MRAHTVLIGISGGLALLTACGAGGVEPIALDEPFDRVVLDVDSGAIDIAASTSGRAEVSRTIEKGAGASELSWDLRNGTLYLNAACHKNNPLKCEVDHVLTLPSGVAVDVALGGGVLTLYAVDGDVDVAMGTGTVDASYLRSPTAYLTVGTGDMSVEYADAPASLDAALGAGHLDLAVPQGTYAASFDVGLGQLDVYGILDDPSADASLRAAVGEGDLAVFGY